MPIVFLPLSLSLSPFLSFVYRTERHYRATRQSKWNLCDCSINDRFLSRIPCRSLTLFAINSHSHNRVSHKRDCSAICEQQSKNQARTKAGRTIAGSSAIETRSKGVIGIEPAEFSGESLSQSLIPEETRRVQGSSTRRFRRCHLDNPLNDNARFFLSSPVFLPSSQHSKFISRFLCRARK